MAKKYSTDPTTKNSGGVLNGVHQGAAGRRAQRTRRSRRRPTSSSGPVKGQFGYYVFEVTKITPATQQTLAKATPLIKQQLTSQSQTSRPDRGRQHGQEGLAQPDDVPRAVRDGRLQGLQGAEDGDHQRRRRPRGELSRRSRRPPRRSPGSTRSRAGCDVDARGTASRTSARSCPTRSRRPTSSPTPRTVATTRSCSTSSATCCSRSTSSRCCSRSAAPATSRRSPTDVTEKLIRRHPHVFGEVEAETPQRGPPQLGSDQAAPSPGREPGVFGEVPENLPAPLYARKVQRRAATQRLRLPRRRGPAPVRARRARRARGAPAPPTSASTSSATCCSRSSTWPASCRSIPSWRCARRPTGSGRGCRPAASSPHPKAVAGTISAPTSSSRTTPARA